MQTPGLQLAFNMPMQLGESPLWHPREHRLYWIDIDGRAVHRLDPQNNMHQVLGRCHRNPAQLPGRQPAAWCVACAPGLAMLDTDSGTLSMFADALRPGRERFNDGRCDAAGRFWVGTIYEPRDRPEARLYVLDHGMLRDSGKRATVSNGVAFSPDNRTLYHSDTTSHCITAYDYDVATGAIENGMLLHRFSTERGAGYGGRPDGAAVDSEGNYWCAMYEGGRLLQLAPTGAILREILLPVRCPTMMAFGGSDLRTLYITTVSNKRSAEELAACPLSGCLLSLRVDVPGQAEHPYLP